MHEKAYQTLQDSSQSLRQTTDEFEQLYLSLTDKEGGRFDIVVAHPEVGYSVSALLTGVRGLSELIAGLQDNPSILVPRSFIDSLATKANELRSQISSYAEQLKTFPAQHGGIAKIDTSAISLVTGDGNTQPQAKPLNRSIAALDGALAAYYQLRIASQAPKLGEFAEQLGRVTELSAKVQQFADGLDREQVAIDKKRQEIDQLVAAADSERKEVSRLYSESQNDRKTLSEYAADGTEKITAIRAAQGEASSLATATADYQAAFKRFDDQLAAREQKFVQENEELEKIKKGLADRTETVVSLIAESEGMLRGATNAGLAASFSDLQSKINSELRSARRGFYFSIALLLVLSLPIALYVFPGANELFRYLGWDLTPLAPRSDGHKTPEVIAQILARALLLMPGIWLVRFTASRHERLFRLREHYAYKYSVASSVEGFKKQAPELEQGIAAAAFHELTFNPATRMDANSAESRHPNPVMEWVMKKLASTGTEAKS
jgi:hypothetical protein